MVCLFISAFLDMKIKTEGNWSGVCCTLWILKMFPDYTREESWCKQRAGPWGAAHCGRCWLQPPEISAVPWCREQAVLLWLGILRRTASVIHHHCCPSKAAGSGFTGPRVLQFHCSALCEQHYVCYNLLSWQPPLASCIRSPGAGVPFVFLALQSHLTLGWRKDKGLLQQRLQILSPAACTHVEWPCGYY